MTANLASVSPALRYSCQVVLVQWLRHGSGVKYELRVRGVSIRVVTDNARNVVNVPRFPRFVIEDWQHFGWGLSHLEAVKNSI
jgi:hypothetical protein